MFDLLGDATRVRILDVLARTEVCVSDLATLLELSESAVSHQLRLLRSLRLVRPRRDGRMMFYALDDRHVVDLFQQGLEHAGESAPARIQSSRPGVHSRGGSGIPGDAARPEEESDGFVRPGRRSE
jgi:DNA-binding transcriptional ArsR family regulator